MFKLLILICLFGAIFSCDGKKENQSNTTIEIDSDDIKSNEDKGEEVYDVKKSEELIVDTLSKSAKEHTIMLKSEGDKEKILFNGVQVLKIVKQPKNYVFIMDGSGDEVKIKGDELYQVTGSRIQFNEETGDIIYLKINEKSIKSSKFIEEFKIIGDFEAMVNIAIGLKKGKKLRLVKNEIWIE